MRVSSSRLLVATYIFQLAAATLLLPEPITPFQVTLETLELTDLDRPDPYNETHPRRFMISKFSPVPRPACLKTCRVPYTSAAVASVLDDWLNPVSELFPEGENAWPRGVLAETEMELCCEVKKSCHSNGHAEEKFPTVLFAPGFEVSRLLYSNTAQHIAGMGYEVILMDHPYEATAVEFPDGTMILGEPVDWTSAGPETFDFILDARAADAVFVLDTLGFTSTDKVIHMGHSLGGAATAVAMVRDDRIAGGIDLDGTMFGTIAPEGVDRPMLLWGSTMHGSAGDDTWGEFINNTASRGAWVKELTLGDSTHESFYDVSLFVEFLGLHDKDWPEANPYRPILGSRVMEIEREYVSEFIKFALGAGEGELLKGPSERFSEVSFLG